MMFVDNVKNKGLVEIMAVLTITLSGILLIWGIDKYLSSSEKISNSDTIIKPSKKVSTITNTNNSSSTPEFEEFPFMELTIPYLRFRDYSSNLAAREIYEKKSNYTAYTTSYLSDGLKVNSYLTIPDGNMPEGGWPAIVFIHGYIPPTVYKTTQNYVSYVDYFARNGFVVIKPDLRGHDKSEGEPMGAYYSGDYVIDTLNAYSALENSDFVNPGQIGLWGHSMGGNIVFRSLIARQDIPAAVIWAGAVYTYEDMQEFSIQDNSYRPPTDDSIRRKYREELNKTYGSFDKESDFWKKVVPTNYLEGVSSNLQLHHPIDDNVVNVGYSRNLVDILKDSTVNAELIEYQTGGHNIISPSYERAMQSSVEFYKNTFKIN